MDEFKGFMKQLKDSSLEEVTLLCQVLQENLREVEDVMMIDEDAKNLLEAYQLLLIETLEMASVLSRELKRV